MQFVVIAYDYKDGLKRRLAVRDQHVALGDKMNVAGTFLYGVAMLSDNGIMKGSIEIFEFPSRNELDKYLEIEPYVVNNVWEKIEVIPCKVGPSFTK